MYLYEILMFEHGEDRYYKRLSDGLIVTVKANGEVLWKSGYQKFNIKKDRFKEIEKPTHNQNNPYDLCERTHAPDRSNENNVENMDEWRDMVDILFGRNLFG